MQLTSKDGNMVVDFYPVKFSDGTMHNRLVLKVVTFCGQSQSKRYINKKDVAGEINSRMEGYGYEMTRLNTIPQLFNSGLACSCQFMSLIKSYLHTKMTDQLEMLTQREQLMWDIDGIVDEFACNNNISEDDMEDLIRVLCDAVCKNFPTK